MLSLTKSSFYLKLFDPMNQINNSDADKRSRRDDKVVFGILQRDKAGDVVRHKPRLTTEDLKKGNCRRR